VAHLDDVALQRVQIQHQTGGLDLRLVHPRQRGDVVAHFQTFEIRVAVHVLSPHFIHGRRSRSTLPPVTITPMRRPRNLSRLARMQASGTALDGSITIFIRFQISFIASTIWSSVAVSTSFTWPLT